MQRDRDPESTTTYPATIVVPRGDGTEVSVSIRIRTRGHSRPKPTVCAFAPLRLEFESNPASVKRTFIDGCLGGMWRPGYGLRLIEVRPEPLAYGATHMCSSANVRPPRCRRLRAAGFHRLTG